MKIVITGGTGFLGRHLVRRFAEHHEVIFSGRKPHAFTEVMEFLGNDRGAQACFIEHGSIEAQADLNAITAKADIVIHNAALSSPWGTRAAFERANVISTQEVIQACELNGVPRLIFISSPSIYFDFTDRVKVKENTPLPKPVNHYARTKLLAEQAVQASNIDQTFILRPRALFGPWDMTLMPRLLRVINKGPFPLMRGGNALVDLTYIDNAVDAVELCCTAKPVAAHSVFNVSNGEPKTIKELLLLVAHQFKLPLKLKAVPWPLVKSLALGAEYWGHICGGREPAITRYSAGVMAFGQTLDISAIQQQLGYQPRVAIDQGLHHHAHWYQQHFGSGKL